MYSHFVAEMIAKQKVEELRKEAEINRMLKQASRGEQGHSSIVARFFSWLSNKPGNRKEAHPAGSKGSPCVDGGSLI